MSLRSSAATVAISILPSKNCPFSQEEHFDYAQDKLRDEAISSLAKGPKAGIRLNRYVPGYLLSQG
jgi:hypothetical protein